MRSFPLHREDLRFWKRIMQALHLLLYLFQNSTLLLSAEYFSVVPGKLTCHTLLSG